MLVAGPNTTTGVSQKQEEESCQKILCYDLFSLSQFRAKETPVSQIFSFLRFVFLNPTQTLLPNLEDGQAGLREGVEVTPAIVGLGEAPSEDLHAQQRENEDEQEEDDQQRVDGGDGVDQGLHQVPHGGPVSVRGREARPTRQPTANLL